MFVASQVPPHHFSQAEVLGFDWITATSWFLSETLWSTEFVVDSMTARSPKHQTSTAMFDCLYEVGVLICCLVNFKHAALHCG